MKILVTGNAGFIGFHTAKQLLERGDEVVGFDSVNDYYDVNIKEARLKILEQTAAQTGSAYTFIRGNLADQAQVNQCFIPLPLGAIHNARSMVALDNLVDLLVTCLKHPTAAGQTFLVSDGEDVSTTELLRRTANALGKKAFLFPVTAWVLEWGATLLGKRAVAQRLCGSLQVDIAKTRSLLGWNPPLTLDQGLKKAVEGMKP